MSSAFEVESEFASIRVELDMQANGPRIRIVDLRAGVERHLDPLVLESIVWATDEQLAELMDPAHRWSVETGEIDDP